jgi:hypothetical protein
MESVRVSRPPHRLALRRLLPALALLAKIFATLALGSLRRRPPPYRLQLHRQGEASEPERDDGPPSPDRVPRLVRASAHPAQRVRDPSRFAYEGGANRCLRGRAPPVGLGGTREHGRSSAKRVVEFHASTPCGAVPGSSARASSKRERHDPHSRTACLALAPRHPSGAGETRTTCRGSVATSATRMRSASTSSEFCPEWRDAARGDGRDASRATPRTYARAH